MRGCDRAGVHRTAVMARSCPAPGSHPSTNRLEPAPPSAGPLSLGLPIPEVLAAPRFALSPILARNAPAFHRVTGSRRRPLYPLSCGASRKVRRKRGLTLGSFTTRHAEREVGLPRPGLWADDVPVPPWKWRAHKQEGTNENPTTGVCSTVDRPRRGATKTASLDSSGRPRRGLSRLRLSKIVD